jgi:hypothetical protein
LGGGGGRLEPFQLGDAVDQAGLVHRGGAEVQHVEHVFEYATGVRQEV